MNGDMSWSWFVVFVFRSEAEVVQALLVRPTLAFRLAIPAAEGSKMVSGLHTPGVFVVPIVHAVDFVIFGLDTHTGSIILNPLA
jgi:hypothetical protein